MTKQWLKYWNNKDSSALDTLFPIDENVAQNVLYQLNARHDNILCEFGCGTGKLASLVEKSVARSVGVDFAEERIRGLIRKTEVLLNDSFDVELKDECIDRVFCFSLLNFLTLEECIATIGEMVRITKKGGFILLGDILKDEAEDIFHLKMKNNDIKCPEMSFYNQKTFDKIVENIVTPETPFISYDTKIALYPNNELSFNILIWKK